MKKKLFRSRDNKIIAGICGGIGKYFDIDPNLVRVIATFICLTPPGIFNLHCRLDNYSSGTR